MKDSKWTWRLVSLVSITATLLFIVGFAYAVNDIVNPRGDVPPSSLPKETVVAERERELKIIAIGDSLAKGTGDNTGNGFVKRTVEGLATEDQKAVLLGNLGINGLTTTGLQMKLEEEGVQYSIRQANTILVSIGGNDLFRGIPEETPAEQEELSSDVLITAIPEVSKRLEGLLQQIAEINPEARIYYLGLYNPFGDVPEMLTPGNVAVTAWNNAAMDIINRQSNMMLVPTFDLFHNHLEKYLSSDHFHPNGEGYQRIAERMIQAIR